ncbi:MAG: 50S ribosomal protein L24 [Endomicrobium sp.]|jgi:large subunit ribosomal protein L24|nr:50S ribosomal protein L24 [Endomicrobium sp.]
MFSIKKEDEVMILSGKYKGIKSKVIGVLHKKYSVLLKNINLRKKRNKNNKNSIQENESPIYLSKVILICKKCNKTVRPKFNIENGKKIRVCRHCNQIIL